MATSQARSIVKAYKDIGTFRGVLLDDIEIPYSKNYSTIRKRVKITDTRGSVLSALQLINTLCESIWTGLREENGSYVLYVLPKKLIRFWRGVGKECTYRIKRVKSVSALNWQRKKYDALIDITLEVLLYTNSK